MNFERRKPSLKHKIYGRQAVGHIALASGERVRPSKTVFYKASFDEGGILAVLRRGVVKFYI